MHSCRKALLRSFVRSAKAGVNKGAVQDFEKRFE